jgi:large subunit ribosomal protein L24
MQKYHVKKGDSVLVITGVHKGKEAKIAAILPKKERVVLEGISSGKMKTVKRTQENQGGLVERAVSTHISNVKKIDAPVEKKKTAPKSKKVADGDK